MPFKSLANVAENILTKLDVAVRRKSSLGQHRWLRKALLGPYRKLINLHGRGVQMNISGCIPARMPPANAWKIIEAYEIESMTVLKRWLDSVQNPLVVDVGCALGFVSCAGLFGNGTSRVIAIDSNLNSVKATQNICMYAPQVGERLFLVWGFASNAPTERKNFREAHRVTLDAFQRTGVSGNPDDAHYICLDSAGGGEASIPRYALDDLLPLDLPPAMPVLIKCDVEGAELLVLNSATRVLKELNVSLLLSVHPTELPKYGASKEVLKEFLASYGFRIEIVAIDHEEHWWCVKGAVD